jgi:dipeptidase
MNEHQVAIGESTCASKFWAAPTTAGGKAMIEVREMSKIALERTTTAREAVLLMGSLAEERKYVYTYICIYIFRSSCELLVYSQEYFIDYI